MPHQSFATADSPGTPLVTLNWVGDHHDVEVASGSTVLTRIGDPAPLRTTGLRGTDPQGVEIFVRLVNTGVSEEFQVLRNNVPLIGSLINNDAPDGGSLAAFGAAMGSSGDQVSVNASTALGSSPSAAAAVVNPERDALQTRARKWLKGLGYLAFFGGVLVMLVSMSDDVDNPAGVRVAGVVTFIIGAIYFALGKLAVGERARSMFGVGAGLTGLLALSNIASIGTAGPRAVISTLLPAITCVHCVKAFKAS